MGSKGQKPRTHINKRLLGQIQENQIRLKAKAIPGPRKKGGFLKPCSPCLKEKPAGGSGQKLKVAFTNKRSKRKPWLSGQHEWDLKSGFGLS